MRSYKPLVKKLDLSAPQQWELLSGINAVSPGNKKAWQEIVRLSRDQSFEKEYAKHLSRFFPKMVDELIHSPDELPEMAKTIFQNQTLKKQEKKSYQYLIEQLGASNRADIAFEAAIDYSKSLQAEHKYSKSPQAEQKLSEAFNVLTYVALKHPIEANHIHAVLDRIDELVALEPRLKDRWALFYDQFLPESSKLGQWPAVFWSYNLDMLNWGLKCYQKCNIEEKVQETKQAIAKKEKEKADWESGFQQWLKEETKRQIP